MSYLYVYITLYFYSIKLQQLKAKPDNSIATELILLGILFLIGYYFSDSLQKHPLGYFWLALSITTLCYGFWKIERYEIKNAQLIKKNFFGLFTKTADLKKLKQKQIKKHKTGTSPFIFISLFKNTDKYRNFQKVKLTFDNGQKITIYQNTIATKDFYRLKKLLKN